MFVFWCKNNKLEKNKAEKYDGVVSCVKITPAKCVINWFSSDRY